MTSYGQLWPHFGWGEALDNIKDSIEGCLSKDHLGDICIDGEEMDEKEY